MVGPFFSLAMLSISRQKAFRRAVIVHLLVLASAVWAVYFRGSVGVPLLGQFLLIAGIVEGAILLGWRLTQLPKSQALEFLLVSPLRPGRVFLAEALVGLSRLALVTLSSLPVLALLVFLGRLEPFDLAPLLVMPFTWGAITGLGLTVWAYEPATVRRIGERAMLGFIMLYLVVGVLAAERLVQWLELFPEDVGWALLMFYRAFHIYNPFAVMQYVMEQGWWEPFDATPSAETWAANVTNRVIGLEAAALGIAGLLLWRAGARLKGHFHDWHYKPVLDPTGDKRGTVGDRPLAWWAVKRVTRYSGRINLWLAGGFGLIYASYTVAGAYWPDWLGRRVFEVLAAVGGIPVLSSGLVVLAAVPAAFQYGLWDSNNQDRCRRLELLLLTSLDGRDYWEAAAAAAWRRGRGYFMVALLLWTAGTIAGQISWTQFVAALAAGIILWWLYFALGFRAFSRGMQANGLGSALTLGLPLMAFFLAQAHWPLLAALTPPGGVFYAAAQAPTLLWALGPMLGALAAWIASRHALVRCDGDLRRWYNLHHGSQTLD